MDSSMDITDLKRAEEALRLSEQRYRSLVEATSAIVWTLPASGLADESEQPSWAAFTSQPTDQLIGWGWLEALHPDDRAVTAKVWSQAVATRSLYQIEYRVRRHDGEYRHMLTRGVPIVSGDGEVREWFGTCVDISELKQAEEALRASEGRFRVFVDHAADAFFLMDEQGRVVDVNHRACASLGYTREELIGMTPIDFSGLTPSVIEDRLRQVLAEETIAFEDQHRRKDGTVFPVEIRAKAFQEGDRRFLVGLARDVTERKRLEEELRLANARLDLALRGANVGIWDIDMPDGEIQNGRVHYVNIWEQLGYERYDSSTDQGTGLALIHPDDRIAHAEAVRKYLAGETSEFEVEIRACHKDGSTRWLISRGVAVRDAGGKPIRFLGTGIDITDRKRAEEALRESEERFRQLAENVRGVFWLQEAEWGRFALHFSSL